MYPGFNDTGLFSELWMVCRQRLRRVCSRLSFFLLFVFTGISAYAQLLDTRITINLGPGSLDKCFLQLQQTTGVSFAYESSGLKSFATPARSFKNEKLHNVLSYLLEGTGYIFKEKHHGIIIGPAKGAIKQIPPVYEFNGVIEDKETGIKLEGVAVYDPSNGTKGTFTDRNGYFSLTAPSDTLKLHLSYLSYKPIEIILHAVDAPLVRIRMNVVPENLDSVMIGNPDDISPFPFGMVSPNINKLSFLPKFSGDVDLISLLKTMPGVQEAKDGSGTLIVRGGAPDQNLLLVDDATVYGTSHLFGLTSSVNANTVKEMDVYKGIFPARFSGRISSVWDITTKEGNPERVHGILSLGTMASDLMLEGPIGKTTTFMIAGRRSYHDIYARLFTPGLTFYFQDFNFKLHQRLSNKDHLYLSGYASQDRFQLNADDPIEDPSQVTKHSIKLNTDNYAGTLRWRHDYSAHLISNVSLLYSSYNLSANNQYTSTYFFPNNEGAQVDIFDRTKTGLYDLTGKFDLKYTPNTRHEIETGIYYTRHSFNPYKTSLEFTSTDPTFVAPSLDETEIKDTASKEAGFYLEDKISISEAFKASLGFHINNYTYDKKSYFSFQPRINLSYRLGKGWFLNAAYVRMQQNLHRLTNNLTNLPVDAWIPANSAIKPKSSNQVSLGFSGRPWNGLFDIGIETYYRDLNNVAEYLANVVNVTPPMGKESNWRNEVTIGKGVAYGIEFSVRKSQGRFSGWLNYALAWSNRTLPEVNNGKTFSYKYDRRHNLNLVALYKLSKSFDISAVFAFQSRLKAPTPIIKTTDQSDAARNIKDFTAGIDIRAYHRLDIGINWHKEYLSGMTGTWNLSIFNVYNRESSFYYFFGNSRVSGNSLLPVSAALSYTLKF